MTERIIQRFCGIPDIAEIIRKQTISGADLYLLNPSGLMSGPNASLAECGRYP